MIIFRIIKSLLIAVLFLFNILLMPTLNKFHEWMCKHRQTNDFIWTLFWFYYPLAMIFIAPLGFMNENQNHEEVKTYHEPHGHTPILPDMRGHTNEQYYG